MRCRSVELHSGRLLGAYPMDGRHLQVALSVSEAVDHGRCCSATQIAPYRTDKKLVLACRFTTLGLKAALPW